MVFSSMLFLWIFLPIVFIVYRFIAKEYRNGFLLLCSLFFYAWGEPSLILVMIFSISLNYTFGFLIDKTTASSRTILLFLCVFLNISVLGYFKYFNFILGALNTLFGKDYFTNTTIMLPIGISFYTFQALSYIIDLYRREIPVQKNFLNLALYISFFPQLIAGPIIKYKDVQAQIVSRSVSISKLSYGMKRFIYGLGKKIILANSFALVADDIFSREVTTLGTEIVWMGAILYTLQIYYDFSGYSDMAIGLGKMFGFDFLENFNYPYIASSIQDFWKRWHISLSTWFKEYLYIPLGGNRKGNFKTYVNLLIVFFVTGLWHGAGYTFIFWGLYHGVFLVLERAFLGQFLKKPIWKMISHIYTILVIVVGWVFFRASGFEEALLLVKTMFIHQNGTLPITYFLDSRLLFLLLLGLLLCGILQSKIAFMRNLLYSEQNTSLIEIILLTMILFFSIMLLASNSYNPFIYFRF